MILFDRNNKARPGGRTDPQCLNTRWNRRFYEKLNRVD